MDTLRGLAVAAQPRPIGLPLAGGGSAGTTVQVHPLRCGEVLLPPRALDRPRGPLRDLRGAALTTPRARWSWVPVPVFLVEHPTAGLLLIDTGFHASLQADPRTSLGRRQPFFQPPRLGSDESAPARLRALGVDPEQIGLVVMTHLHIDHASGASQFPRATFVVDAQEWRAACVGGFREGYRHAHLDGGLDWRTVDDAGAVPHAGFERTRDLFGDGSVRLLATPGHTPGHQSILLALEGRELLLTGDAAYTRRTIDEDLVPLYLSDVAQYRRSLAALRDYARRTPDAVVICGHDADCWPHVDPLYA